MDTVDIRYHIFWLVADLIMATVGAVHLAIYGGYQYLIWTVVYLILAYILPFRGLLENFKEIKSIEKKVMTESDSQMGLELLHIFKHAQEVEARMTSEEYKALIYIDNQLLDNIEITDEERQLRRVIVAKWRKELKESRLQS